jgi:hypothetical protein
MSVLFFTSLSTILFELALTRVFSILLWYDYAFMAISVAFFGLGIGSLYVYMRRDLGRLRTGRAGRASLLRQQPDKTAAAAPEAGDVVKRILYHSMLYAVSVPTFLVVVAQLLPPDPSFIYLFYFASSVPFFFAGSIMALVFSAMPRRISKLYFADLVGAASAALLLDPLMVALGAESVLLLTSLLVAGPAVAAAFVFLGRRGGKKAVVGRTEGGGGGAPVSAAGEDAPGKSAAPAMSCRLKASAAALLAGLVALMIVTVPVGGPAIASQPGAKNAAADGDGGSLLKVHPGSSKGLYWQLRNAEFTHLSAQWNSFSRVDVTTQRHATPDGSAAASAAVGQGTGDPANRSASPLELGHIIIDADAGTPIYPWSGSRQDLGWMHQYMDYLPYELLSQQQRGARHALVIGSGGGQDILMAIAGGADKVTAVEINPLIVSAVKRFGVQAGNLYDRGDLVDLHMDDGRRFISSSAERYDVITIKLVDSWAAQLAGGYALSENYLYTVEAFQQYFRHLNSNSSNNSGGNNDGMLAMVRWSFELPRLMPVVAEAVARETGKTPEEAAAHVVVVEDRPGLYFGRTDDAQQWYPVLVLVKSSPFTAEQLGMIEKRAQEGNANVVMLGSRLVAPPYDLLFSSSSSSSKRDDYARQVASMPGVQVTNTRLPTDDSPFYFAREPVPRQMVLLLETVLAISAGLSVLLVYHAKRTNASATFGHRAIIISNNNDGRSGAGWVRPAGFVLFAVFIGLGFMILEVTFIQKFLLLLGTPIMALTVILFSILLSGGIGAYLSGRLFGDGMRRGSGPYRAVFVSVPLLAGIILVYLLALPGVIAASITADLPSRAALTFALLFPPGLLMGFQFPSLIRMATAMQGQKGDSGGSSYKSSDNDDDGNNNDNNSTTLLWGINIVASIVGTVLAATLAMVIGFSGNFIVGIAMYAGAGLSALAAFLTSGGRRASDRSLPLAERD